jgi:hypothetical protein
VPRGVEFARQNLVLIVSGGNPIYAAADNQTVGSLAQILIRAGRGLGINSYWDAFITYVSPTA